MSIEFDKVHDAIMGNLQKSQGERKVLSGRPETLNNRYRCQLCDKIFMSDESLQLHILHHDFISLVATLRELFEEKKSS